MLNSKEINVTKSHQESSEIFRQVVTDVVNAGGKIYEPKGSSGVLVLDYTNARLYNNERKNSKLMLQKIYIFHYILILIDRDEELIVIK